MLKKAFKYLLGESDNFSIEERLFLSALLIGILLGLMGTITNFILIDNTITILAPLFCSLILGNFYSYVRVKRLFDKLAFPIIISSFFAMGIIWIINGGIDGSNDTIFLIALILGLILVNNRKKIFVLILFIAIKTVLYFIQLYNPEIIQGFPSENARWFDVFTASLYTPFLVYLIISFLHRNYTLERQKVDDGKKVLEELNIELNASNETKDLFFSIISHDLKSPFNSILGFSDLLVNNAANYDTDKIKIFAKSINTVAGETYHLLENLLKWTRLQQGMIEPDYSVENLLLLSNQIVSLYSELAKTKEIDIENHIEPEIFIYCDIEITKIVIRNFLANAIKFTAPKGNISIWARIIEQMVEIKITDNGIGIEPENIDELFKLNPKGSTKGTSNETGTGIGLYLSKVFIEKQGGKIGVESAPGKGSTFSFTVEKHSKPNI